ncbi:MAG: MFS transporter [Thermoplasmata archaeon]|nr:MFS transporter [Thermoplasmata archaeon]
MTPLPAGERAKPAAALFIARVVYALNWYNVGAVLPLIGASFGIGTARLGLVLGAFLVGVGIFQVPAGFAAIRFGARRVSLAGLAVMAVAGIVSGFAPTYLWLAAARCVAGVGAAFFFSPGLSLIASYYPEGQRGPVIGLYNGGFSVGGAIGLFGGALLGQLLGWPVALASAGGALLLTAGAASLLLPPETEPAASTVRALWMAGRPVLRSRSIWALSLGLTGFWAAMFIIAQYFVKFGHDVHPEWGPSLAAALAATLVIISFPGGPLGGWLAERGWDRRVTVGVFAAGASLLVLTIPFAPLWLLWPIFLFLGLIDGVIFAILYVIPTYLAETQGQGLALGLAVVNSIQVLCGSALAITFGWIASQWGFTPAWAFTAATSLGLIPLLAWVAPNRGEGSGSRGDPAPVRPAPP